jgi:hypothetical protein
MKTTKKQFIEQLTNSNSIFLGVARQDYNESEIECILADYIENKCGLLNQRTVKKATNERIVFCDDGVLYLNQCGDYIFHAFDFSGKKILRVTHKTVDDFDNSEHIKAMYYGIA